MGDFERERSGGGARRSGPASPEALQALFDATVALFHRLSAAAAEAHGPDGPTAAYRGILRGLARDGASTVPQMARSRHVTRQHVQALVNGLAERGDVELVDNPAHRRSRLVRLTPSGQRVVRSMAERESALLQALRPGVSRDEVEAAVTVLDAVRLAFDGDRWRRVLQEE